MSFSYNNYNNEEVKLNLKVGANWDSLNIENQYLNTIFAKIDDGDRNISEDELSTLERILNKANNIKNNIIDSMFPFKPNKTKISKVLSDEDLKVVVEKINNGEIQLPKKRQLAESRYLEFQYTPEQYEEIRKDSKGFYDKQIEKIKIQLKEKYAGDYEINVSRYKNGYKCEVFDLDTNRIKNNANKGFTQSFTKIRSDGISLEIMDCYKDTVVDDESKDYSNNHQSASFGVLTITDKEGKAHNISYHLLDCSDRDALDCRRIRDKAMEFLNKLPTETIEKLLKNNVESISFSAEFDDPLIDDPDYYKSRMDKNGNVVDIAEGSATIISKDFALKERNYKTERNIQRDDNINVEIADTGKNTGKINVKADADENFSIEIQGSSSDENGDKFHQWQLPRLEKLMNELPAAVLKDLKNEITNIKFLQKNIGSDSAGLYSPGTNALAFRADADSDTPTISFVHELGHAIDDQNGTFLSSRKEFTEKFTNFQKLYQKYFPDNYNHACDNAQEFFASTYAYIQLPNDKVNNHIGDLDDIINKLASSGNTEEQELYKLFTELKQEVNNDIDIVRNKPKKERADNTLSQLVKKECSDLIAKFNKYGWYLEQNFDSQSLEIDLTRALAENDTVFNAFINGWKKYAEDKKTSAFGDIIPTPPEIQELYSELIQKAQELRLKINHAK